MAGKGGAPVLLARGNLIAISQTLTAETKISFASSPINDMDSALSRFVSVSAQIATCVSSSSFKLRLERGEPLLH